MLNYKKFPKRLLTALTSFKLLLSTGWISLLIITIIISIIQFMPQGGTLIIDLLNEPLQLFFFIILTLIFSLVVSHYPEYFEKNRWFVLAKQNAESVDDVASNRSNEIVWDLWPKWAMGIVTYKDKRKDNSTVINYYNVMKRSLGIFFLWIPIFYLGKAYAMYVDNNVSSWWYNLWSLLGFIVLYFIFSWYLYKKKRTTFFYVFLNILVVFSIVLFILILVFSYTYHWHRYTFWLLIGFYYAVTLIYILFRNLRTEAKFVNSHSFLRLLGCHRYYLGLFSACGFFSAGIFIASHWFECNVNPLVVILTLLYFFYGLIVVPIKHKMYYDYIRENKKERCSWYCTCNYNTFWGRLKRFFKKEKKEKRIKCHSKYCKKHWLGHLFIYGVPFFPIAFIILSVIIVKSGSNLHTLYPDKDATKYISEGRFVKELQGNLADADNIYFISSYGGGLTANIWNCLLLDTLLNPNGNYKINPEHIVSMSGVSGGGMGHGIYMSIYDNYTKAESRRAIIDEIAATNFLSPDISWMFGWDFVRQYFIYEKEFDSDRAKYSMEKYADLLNDENVLSTSYYTYYADVFEKNYYPALLENTASTHSTRGVNCSIKLDSFASVFHGADNMLDYEVDSNKSLSYFDALSTVNRFPLLSPAAKIETKGHFIDGGYFENSGSLSTLNFYNYLKNIDSLKTIFDTKKVVFIQIMNSKGNLIEHLMSDTALIKKKMSESGEVEMVLKTGTTIAQLPLYLEENIKQLAKDTLIDYVPIVLPFYLIMKDFKKHYAVDEFDDSTIKFIEEIIIKNNERVAKIRTTNTWSTAEPPLARLLTLPAYTYMKNAVKDSLTLHLLRAD